ncbi:MAG: YciI family protein [Actinomycetota bacterium]
MTQFLFSVHSVEGEVGDPMTDEEMQQSWKQVQVLEEEMKSTGAWVFAGRLHEPDTATVVRMSEGEVLTTDGPFAESKEHLGGFYIIEAPDLDAALAWAAKVTDAVRKPIEVRPFWSEAQHEEAVRKLSEPEA